MPWLNSRDGRALIALPMGPRRVADQGPRPFAWPRVVGLEVGAGDRDRVAARVGAAVHDPGTGGHERAQLAGRLQHQPRRFGADQVTRLTRRQRIRRRVEVRVLRFVPAAVGLCAWRTGYGRKDQKQDSGDSPEATHSQTLTRTARGVTADLDGLVGDQRDEHGDQCRAGRPDHQAARHVHRHLAARMALARTY